MRIDFSVKNQVLRREDKNRIVSDSVNYLNAAFTFSKDWDGLIKTVAFKNNAEVYNVQLESNQCEVPQDIIKATGFTVSLRGDDGETVITTDEVIVEVEKSGYVSGKTPESPSTDVYAQIIALYNETVELSSELETKVESLQEAIDELTIPTNVSELTNDSNYQSDTQVSATVQEAIDEAVKIDTVKVNGVEQSVVDKAVDISVPTDGLSIYSNAGAHNCIYRGKAFGTSVTDEQYAEISAGTFEDLYIGDYWTIDNVNYRIAAFDYYYNCGDTSCTTHHIVVVPDTTLYTHVMNSTDITTGGYVGSEMYTEGLDNAKTTITEAFSGHVLSHRIYLTNAVGSGRPSASTWCDSEVDLMNEQMVYGGAIFMPMCNGTTISQNHRLEKSQLPLFSHNTSMINIRTSYWLRDVVTDSQFAYCSDRGLAHLATAGSSVGVRPFFCIY